LSDIPFLARGVPILHLISVPYPSVWHTPDDTMKKVDMESVKDLTNILKVALAEYFHLKY
jgi:glutaminyl-peptide cyclotransferase